MRSALTPRSEARPSAAISATGHHSEENTIREA
jgi:hypothetical protein